MHPDMERYLGRATRGLWGQQRQLVRQELLGAIEDHIWRHTVDGCGEAEAVRRALDDLGTPTVIAAGMRRTHTLPQVLPWAGVLALLTALSVVPLTQSLAQVVAAPLNLTALFCDASPAGTQQRAQQLTPDGVRIYERVRQVGAVEIDRLCVSMTSDPYEVIKRASLLVILQAQGVKASATPPADWVKRFQVVPPLQGWRWLTFPGSATVMPLVPVGRVTRPLISVYELVYTLLDTRQLPLQVEGEINPRVIVGTTSFVLGTPQTPVRTSLLRTAALARQLDPVLNASAYRGLTYTADPQGQSSGVSETIQVKGRVAERQLVGVLVRFRSGPVHPQLSEQVPEYLLYTTQVRSGRVALLHGLDPTRLQYVDRFEALRRPLPTGVDHQVMLMPLSNANDLANLSYQVVLPPHRHN